MKKIIFGIMIAMLFLLGKDGNAGKESGNYKIGVDSKLLVNGAKIEKEIEEIKEANDLQEKEINKEITDIKIALGETRSLAESNEKTVSGYLSNVAWFTGILFGLVALVLGIGVIKIYIDHRGMIKKIDNEMDDRFKKWWEKKTSEMNDVCHSMAKKMEKEVDDYSYYLKVKMLLVQKKIEPAELYPLIAPLCAEPKKIYKPVFKKIIDLNIDKEITEKANEGLKKM